MDILTHVYHIMELLLFTITLWYVLVFAPMEKGDYHIVEFDTVSSRAN